MAAKHGIMIVCPGECGTLHTVLCGRVPLWLIPPYASRSVCLSLRLNNLSSFLIPSRLHLVFLPDTSPRGHPSIEGESASWDFGLGAGFYVDATEPAFKTNYNM